MKCFVLNIYHPCTNASVVHGVYLNRAVALEVMNCMRTADLEDMGIDTEDSDQWDEGDIFYSYAGDEGWTVVCVQEMEVNMQGLEGGNE